MGLISSSTSSTKPPANNNETIVERYKRIQEEKVVKLLLYGPGEVGKTTILRRMMLKHGNDLTGQRERYRPFLCYNVIEGAYLIIRHTKHKFHIDFTKPATIKARSGDIVITEDIAKHAKRINQAMKYFQSRTDICTLNPSKAGDSIPEDDEIPNGPAVVESIKYFYRENSLFKRVLKQRNTFSLYENWIYFADKLDEYPKWGGPDWTPTDTDLLMSRCRTTGMNKFVFQVNDSKYQLIDVGGQRQERRVFSGLFSQVDAVLFVTSMADYDERCYEDGNAFRLTEGVNAWKSAIASEAFQNVWVMLLFNKVDLFKVKYCERGKKIKPKNLKVPKKPPTYEEEANNECALAKEWFEDLYMDVVPDNKKNDVRVYYTSALGDKEGDRSIDQVMEFCVSYLSEKLIEFGNPPSKN